MPIKTKFEKTIPNGTRWKRNVTAKIAVSGWFSDPVNYPVDFESGIGDEQPCTQVTVQIPLHNVNKATFVNPVQDGTFRSA
jgi:hypothetical protein